MSSIEWLEDYLTKGKRTLLVISHDRYFLDKVTTRTVALEDGKSTLYSGNYSFYAEEKQRIYEETLQKFQRQEREYKRLAASAERLKSFASGQNKALVIRARSMMKRAEKMRTITRPRAEKRMKTAFESREFHSDDLMIAEGLSKSFDGRQIFSGIDLELRGGERVALLGDNGTGKTTLLNVITGSLQPDSGKIRFSPSVKSAYLEQLVRFENPHLSAYDTLLHETNCSPQEARDRLGAFKFSGEDAFKPVSVLSGGELSRLRLCILMREKINLLILDETTNHLDMRSKDVLKQAIAAFNGTAIIVSHDRDFLDGLVSKVYEFGNHQVSEYLGGIYEFLEHKKMGNLQELELPVGRRETSVVESSSIHPTSSKQAYEIRKEQSRQLKRLQKAVTDAEQRIEQLEIAIAVVEMRLSTPEGAADAALYGDYEKLKRELSDAMEEWTKWTMELENTEK